MAERLDCEIRRTLQNEPNNHTFRPGGNNNNLTQFSSDKDYHFLGRLGSSLDLRFPTFKKAEIGDTNRIFDGKSGTTSGKFDENSTGSTGSTGSMAPINREYNVLKRDLETKRNGCEIHDGCVNSLQSTNECIGSRYKDTGYEDVTMGKGCKECPNQRTIEELQTQFGKLRRIGSLGGNVWKPTTPQKTCRFVHAHSRFEESSNENYTTMSQVQTCERNDDSPSRCNNLLLLVDIFEDKSRIATSITLEILDSDPRELIYYIKCIARFGFDHIIIIGETYDGLIFLDCYGRLFLWDDATILLCPLGNSFEEASKYSFNEDRLGWFEEKGIIYEYILKF